MSVFTYKVKNQETVKYIIRFEDAIDAFVQIFGVDDFNGGWLLAWTIGNMCSIAVFNFAGIKIFES